MKFRGFYGEDVQVLKRAGFKDHDHLAIKINGKLVGYFHISEKSIGFFGPSAARKSGETVGSVRLIDNN